MILSNKSTSQTQNGAIWTGCDVAKKTFDVAVYANGGAQPSPKPQIRTFPVEHFQRDRQGAVAFLEWADARLHKIHPDANGAQLRVCMEATGKYSIELAEWLLELRPSLAPAIVNPHYTNAFGKSLGQRNKTDKADARILAYYGAERDPRPYEPPAKHYRELQELARQRKALVRTLVAECQRKQEGTTSSMVAKIRKQMIGQIKKHIGKLDQAIKALVAVTPELRADVALLQSIPGVGFIVAITILCEIGDLRRFLRSRQLSSFVGLSPRQIESGTSVRCRTRMAKKGNARVRSILYMSAMSCLQTKQPNKLSDFYHHLVANGKTKMSALGAVMRKILILMRALLISRKKYDNNHVADGKMLITC